MTAARPIVVKNIAKAGLKNENERVKAARYNMCTTETAQCTNLCKPT